jgi:hypothetical protein
LIIWLNQLLTARKFESPECQQSHPCYLNNQFFSVLFDLRDFARTMPYLGLSSVHHSPLDTKLLILQRFTRFFAFGASTIVLVLYLHTLSIPDSRIGLFLSLTLVGDVLSFLLTLLADGAGRRRVLGLGAALMCMSGLIFAGTGNFWFLIIAGVCSWDY